MVSGAGVGGAIAGGIIGAAGGAVVGVVTGGAKGAMDIGRWSWSQDWNVVAILINTNVFCSTILFRVAMYFQHYCYQDTRKLDSSRI